MIPFNHFGVKPRPRGWRRLLGLLWPLVGWLAVLFAAGWMLGSQCGCAVNESEVVPTPTTQPAGEITAPIATGQVAANLVTQLRSDLTAQLTGLEFNRTVDHALDGGQLLVLLSVIWASHRRGMMRIKNDAKRGGG